MSLIPLEKKLGYKFKDAALLAQALRHSSVATSILPSYEKLEFLGDRVLSLVIAEMLYYRFPHELEGDLAKRLSYLVSEPLLATLGREVGLETLIQAETKGFPRTRPSVLADGVEALLAVIYTESGLETVKEIIQRLWEHHMNAASAPPRDPKSTLQEWAQTQEGKLPTYQVLSKTGPDHKPLFSVQVCVGESIAQAQGSSLRDAEKKAAALLLKQLLG